MISRDERIEQAAQGHMILLFPYEIPSDFPRVRGKMLCHASPLEGAGLRHAFVYLLPEETTQNGFCRICGEFQHPIAVLADIWTVCGNCGSRRGD